MPRHWAHKLNEGWKFLEIEGVMAVEKTHGSPCSLSRPTPPQARSYHSQAGPQSLSPATEISMPGGFDPLRQLGCSTGSNSSKMQKLRETAQTYDSAKSLRLTAKGASWRLVTNTPGPKPYIFIYIHKLHMCVHISIYVSIIYIYKKYNLSIYIYIYKYKYQYHIIYKYALVYYRQMSRWPQAQASPESFKSPSGFIWPGHPDVAPKGGFSWKFEWKKCW